MPVSVCFHKCLECGGGPVHVPEQDYGGFFGVPQVHGGQEFACFAVEGFSSGPSGDLVCRILRVLHHNPNIRVGNKIVQQTHGAVQDWFPAQFDEVLGNALEVVPPGLVSCTQNKDSHTLIVGGGVSHFSGKAKAEGAQSSTQTRPSMPPGESRRSRPGGHVILTLTSVGFWWCPPGFQHQINYFEGKGFWVSRKRLGKPYCSGPGFVVCALLGGGAVLPPLGFLP